LRQHPEGEDVSRIHLLIPISPARATLRAVSDPATNTATTFSAAQTGTFPSPPNPHPVLLERPQTPEGSSDGRIA